jgi:hypothetical protein
VIRIPEVLAEELLRIARVLDEGGALPVTGNLTESDSHVTGNQLVNAETLKESANTFIMTIPRKRDEVQGNFSTSSSITTVHICGSAKNFCSREVTRRLIPVGRCSLDQNLRKAMIKLPLGCITRVSRLLSLPEAHEGVW